MQQQASEHNDARKADGGYALQPRAIFKHEIYQMPLAYRVIWHYLWGMANHSERNGISRGQIFTTLQQLVDVCSYTVGYRKQGISRRDAWRVCEWLRQRNMIVTTNTTTNVTMKGTTNTTRGMLVTIVNYLFWQNPGNYERDNERDDERRTNATRGAVSPVPASTYSTPKNEKNVKKLKKQTTVLPENLKTSDFKAAWTDWLEHLKQKHKPPTTLAKQRQLAKCSKMGSVAAVKMIEHSITSNWQGLFEEQGASHGQRSEQHDQGKPIFGGKPSGLKFSRGKKYIAGTSAS